MYKRGMSAVVTTIIIVLLSLVAIGVVWVVLSATITQQSEESEAKAKMFFENVEIRKVEINQTNLSDLKISLTKLSGKTLTTIEITEAPPTQVDVVSVVDTSGSMRQCYNISSLCTGSGCFNNLGGVYCALNTCCSINNLSKLSNECISVCNGIPSDGLTPTQEANNHLVDALFERPVDNNRLGLVAYNTWIIEQWSLDLTNNPSLLKDAIDLWRSGNGTSICAGIDEAKSKLSGSPEDIMKTMILMTDGSPSPTPSCPNPIPDALQSACDAYNGLANLTIYTVGLGSEVNESLMIQIATQCGNGTYFPAYNVSQLISLYDAIANKILTNSRSLNLFNYLKIVFYTSNESAFRNIPVPNVLETKVYNFDLSNDISNPPIIKIEIYPAFTSSSGKEILGGALDIWEL